MLELTRLTRGPPLVRHGFITDTNEWDGGLSCPFNSLSDISSDRQSSAAEKTGTPYIHDDLTEILVTCPANCVSS